MTHIARKYLEKALDLVKAGIVLATEPDAGGSPELHATLTEAFLHIKAAMGEPEHLAMWEKIQNETL